MIDPDRIYVTTAAFYPDEEPIRYLRRSCEHFGISLNPYGRGKPFVSWRQAKMVDLADHLAEVVAKEPGRYTHFLYTDGADSWFLRGLDHVATAYERIGKRLVISAERECYPVGALHDRFPDNVGPWRFPNAGGFIGEIGFGIETLRMLDAEYRHLDDYNDQAAWLRHLANGCDDVAIDHECDIFLTMTGIGFSKIEDMLVDDKQFHVVMINDVFVISKSHHETTLSGSKRKVWPMSCPCLIHFNGGGTKTEMLNREWQRITKGEW